MSLTIESSKTGWQETLASVQQGPLRLCPTFPVLARRWNDWWSFSADRPLLVLQSRKNAEIRWDKAFDLLDQPEKWLAVRRRQLEEAHFVGEAIPWLRADIGPVAMAAFLGAPLHFAHAEQTSWQDTLIESWEEEVELTLDHENHWLKVVMSLLLAIAEDARDQYLVCLPDLTGAIDVIANMRGSENLCLDLFEYREEILRAADQEVDAWAAVFAQMYDTILGAGAGITQWVECWSDTPFTVPTCDFNALIGPTDFQEICMPSIKKQARLAGRCVFHLDGPDAARHAETLAADSDITAIQYTPGAGTPSALAKMPLFRMFQEYRKPLFIDCPFEEVKDLSEALEPRGVAIRVYDIPTPQEADTLVDWRDGVFG